MFVELSYISSTASQAPLKVKKPGAMADHVSTLPSGGMLGLAGQTSVVY